jgi:hypothetical protein
MPEASPSSVWSTHGVDDVSPTTAQHVGTDKALFLLKCKKHP